MAKLFTEEVFHELAADDLKETTKITQTKTRLKQEESAQKTSVAKPKQTDTRVEMEKTAQKPSVTMV